MRVGTKFFEQFPIPVKVCAHQRPVLSPSLFAIVVYVVTKSVREGLMNEILYAHDLFFMVVTIEDLS